MSRFLARLVALSIVVSLAWAVGGRLLAQRWEREADRAWRVLGTSMTAFPGHFPNHGLSESARKLDAAAARLGIALAPAGASGRTGPSAHDASAFDAVRPDLGTWLDAQIGNPSDRIEAPPEKVAAFLGAHASELEDMVALLRAGEAPVWEQHLDRLAGAPVPFVKGHRSLDRLLCASALAWQRQGRGAEALQVMDAAARAAASLQDRPELISRLVELDLLGTQAGTLRKLEGVAPRWYARSTERDLRRSMIVSLQAEAWVLSTSMDGKARPEPATILGRVSAFYERPYALLAGADYSRALARTAAALQGQEGCAFGPDAMTAVDRRAKDEIGRWNMARPALPSVGGFWTAVDRARFHRELTAKVLELKRLRAASFDGAWPKQVPGIESSACPGNRWTYVVSAGGGAVLTASQSPSRPVPAVRYEGDPPAPARPPATRLKPQA